MENLFKFQMENLFKSESESESGEFSLSSKSGISLGRVKARVKLLLFSLKSRIDTNIDLPVIVGEIHQHSVLGVQFDFNWGCWRRAKKVLDLLVLVEDTFVQSLDFSFERVFESSVQMVVGHENRTYSKRFYASGLTVDNRVYIR